MEPLKTGLRLYKPLLWKKYFTEGLGLTNQFKYLIVLFGWGTGNVKATIWLIIWYALFCLVLGRLWLYSRLKDTETEINNMFNPFVADLRKQFKIPYRERFK